MKQKIYLLLGIVMFSFVVGCQKNYYDPKAVNVTKDTPSPPPVPQIILDNNKLVMEEGDSVQLVAKVSNEPKKGIKILWKTSDSKLARVTTDGKVIAEAKGTATITAYSTDNATSAKCKVKVNALRKAVISDDVPTKSMAGYNYRIDVKFKNCVNPSVKIIASCGGGTIKNANDTIDFGNSEEQFKTTGDVTIRFTTTGNKKINSVRILCYDKDELIDSKEYKIRIVKRKSGGN